jgi:WD40 repeat protein
MLSTSQKTTPPEKEPAPEFVVQSGHTHAVRAVRFSPDSSLLATASNDASVKLWDIRLGREVRTLRGAFSPLYAAAFRPDGRQLAAAGADQAIFIWDVADGRLAATLKGHNGWVMALAFAPSGKTLASAAKDKTLVLWDLANAAPEQVIEHDAEVNRVAWSPDGKTVAAIQGTKARRWDSATKTWVRDKALEDPKAATRLRLWDAATGKAVHTFPFPLDPPGDWKVKPAPVDDFRAGLGFSPDGKYLAATDSGVTYLIDAAAGKPVRALSGLFLSFRHRDGPLCLLPRAGTLHFFNPATGRLLARLTAPGAPDESTIREARRKDPYARWDVPDEQSVFSLDGTLLAGPADRGTVNVWDAATGGRVQRLGGRIGVSYGQGGGNAMRPLTVAWSPAGPVFATGDQEVVRLVDLRKGVAPRLLAGHNGIVNALAFRWDGKVLAAGGVGDDKIRLWDTATGSLLGVLDFSGVTGGTETLAFDPT